MGGAGGRDGRLEREASSALVRDRSLLSSASETAAGHARSSWSCRRSSREVFQEVVEGERSSKSEAYKQGSERESIFGGARGVDSNGGQ